MPIIRIEMFEGRSAAQKRACAEAVTKAWCDTCIGPPEGVTIVFADVAKQDWATAGRLACDPRD